MTLHFLPKWACAQVGRRSASVWPACCSAVILSSSSSSFSSERCHSGRACAQLHTSGFPVITAHKQMWLSIKKKKELLQTHFSAPVLLYSVLCCSICWPCHLLPSAVTWFFLANGKKGDALSWGCYCYAWNDGSNANLICQSLIIPLFILFVLSQRAPSYPKSLLNRSRERRVRS